MKIGTIECIPYEDPYRRNTSADYQTYCQVWCVPGKTIGICQESGAAGNGIPEEEYHNRTLTEGLEGYPDEDEAREYLKSEEVQDLLDRVDDGFEVVWDGNNHVGEMNEDAQTAWDQIIEGLQKLCRELSIAMAGDYCYDEIRSIAQMTEDELDDYDVAAESSTMESEAYDNGCILIGCDEALSQAVNERRDQLFEEMESDADEFASEEYPDYPYQSDLYAMIQGV